ncbi:dibenzothiophene desulfurization enzyme A [Thozetella sp. PMI_491]|nr:dibenzothiophene desulfurization enzyme A [Thozetella sp. PMI_491]
MAKKLIQLNFFENSSCGNASCMGQWKNPKDQAKLKDRLEYYVNLAKLAEKGKITSVFFTDAYGHHEVYENSVSATLMGGGHVGLLDPTVIVGAMAMATKSVGFTVTGSSTYLNPYMMARTWASLDHITDGRVGWNIVTSFSDSSAQAIEFDMIIPHDERYERAHEYMDVLYKYSLDSLCEGSWEDGAQVFDAEKEMAYDPKKIRRVEHEGKFYKMKAYFQTHPSPQRTPVLFQAGALKAGMSFAGKHAEALFVSGPTPEIVKKQVTTVRQEAYKNDRDGSKIKFFLGILPIIGRTMVEAQAKYEEAKKNVHAIGGIARFSGFANLGLSQYPIDEPFQFKGEQSEASIHGIINTVKTMTGSNKDDEPWTPRRLGRLFSLGGTAPSPVGTPAMVADVMEMWMREADIDGFNLQQLISPGSYEDIVELLVPELQRRGIYRKEYPVPGGTMRENILGAEGQTYVLADHPASRFRWDKREEKAVSAWDARRPGLETAPAKVSKKRKADAVPERGEVITRAYAKALYS